MWEEFLVSKQSVLCCALSEQTLHDRFLAIRWPGRTQTLAKSKCEFGAHTPNLFVYK